MADKNAFFSQVASLRSRYALFAQSLKAEGIHEKLAAEYLRLQNEEVELRLQTAADKELNDSPDIQGELRRIQFLVEDINIFLNSHPDNIVH